MSCITQVDLRLMQINYIILLNQVITKIYPGKMESLGGRVSIQLQISLF